MTHTVFFWLRPDLSEEEVASFAAGAKALTAIDTVARGQVGTPAPTPERPVTDKSFSFALHLEFASVADHDAYQVHADHDAFIDQFKTYWERVVVYDSEPV